MRLTKSKDVLTLSSLAHTWILDLDGTIVKHNGYKIDGMDTFLPGAQDFLASIDEKDTILFLTSRTEDMKEQTERFLQENHVRYDAIIYDIPYGERILINDNKPSGLRTAIAIEKKRDQAFALTVVKDEEK